MMCDDVLSSGNTHTTKSTLELLLARLQSNEASNQGLMCAHYRILVGCTEYNRVDQLSCQ